MITEILSRDFDESESWIFQNRSMLSEDFISNIFELHEPKTGGKQNVWFNFPGLSFPNFPELRNLSRPRNL